MDIHRAGVADIVVAPDLVQELLAGKDTAGRGGQEIEELQLLGRHVEPVSVVGDRVIGQVDGQVRIGDDLVRGLLRCGRAPSGMRLVAAQDGLDTGKTDPERVIAAVMALAPQYGGVNLEDIAAPACFEIEDRLDAALDIPVFHDDQWGTAVIALSGVMNYATLAGKELGDLKIVMNGAGAAGIRICEMCKAAGVKDVTMCDSKGVISTSRTDLNPYKARHAVDTAAKTLQEAIRGADVFIGVSAANVLTGADVQAMGEFPAIFAMANPDPEIDPAVAAEALKGRKFVMVTGRSDYPNQINNVLGFPYLFRGALDVRARTINKEMKVAAAHALAALARQPVPDEVKALYPNEALEFGTGYIIPKPFDRRLFVEVSYAVAEAAVKTGVAQKPVDLAAYRADLERRNAERA